MRDRSRRVEIHPQYVGYCRRHDAWRTPEWHRHPASHVIWVVDTGLIRIGGGSRVRTVGPGEFVAIGAGVAPAVVWSDLVELRQVYLRAEGLGVPAHVACGMETGTASPEAGPLLEYLAAESAGRSDAGHPLARARLQLLLELLRRGGDEKPSRTLTPNQRLRLLRWFQTNVGRGPGPEELAEAAGLAPDYFARLFKATFGLPPRDWLIRERIRIARRLLDEEGATVDEAMRQTGFGNVSHFSRQMKRLTGRTPGGHSGWSKRRGNFPEPPPPRSKAILKRGRHRSAGANAGAPQHHHENPEPDRHQKQQ